jgi:tetratricopeptide (TPR) repeat protein
MLAVFDGRLDEAERLGERAAEFGSRAQDLDATFHYVGTLQRWALRREQGRVEEIEDDVERFVSDYPNFLPYPNFIFRAIRANVAAETGRAEEARAALERIVAGDDGELEVGTEWFFGTALLAETCAGVGASDQARLLYEALEPYAGFNVIAQPEASLGAVSRHLGLLAAAMSRWDDAMRHFDDALEMNARMGARTWLAHTQHDLARALRLRGATGDTKRARHRAAEAAAGYRDLGMTRWAERAEAGVG